MKKVSNMVHKVALSLLALTFYVAVSEGASLENKALYDIYGNYLEREYHKYNPDCCIVPECDRYSNCIETIKCDHTCSTGVFPKASHGRTDGYRLKNFYTKYDCKFGECKRFQFTCYHCPSPYTTDFNVYLVRKDCYNCYEKY